LLFSVVTFVPFLQSVANVSGLSQEHVTFRLTGYAWPVVGSNVNEQFAVYFASTVNVFQVESDV